MTTHAMPIPQTGHPAPHRDRVGLLALGFGIVGAPLAWNAQLLIGVALSSHACYPRDVPLAMPIWSGVWSLLLAISGIAIAAGLVAGLVALRSWRRTQGEQPGSAHRLLGSGTGRTRFLAMCGLLSCALFLVALAFATAPLFLVPLCGG